VTIGVRRVDGAFEAHAWVDREGQTIADAGAASQTPGVPAYQAIVSWRR
jgi:hypothetical protein